MMNSSCAILALVVLLFGECFLSETQHQCEFDKEHDAAADLPVVLVIGESGVGKSTFLNYISGASDTSHPCNFKTGSLQRKGVTTETVAVKVKWLGAGDFFEEWNKITHQTHIKKFEEQTA